MPFLDRRNELARDRAAEDVVDELEVAAARQRLELHLAVAELAVAAGLLLVPAVRLGGRGDRLAVGNPRQLQVDLDAEPALQLRDRHLDVRLSLAGEQQLLGLRVAVVAERRILFLQPVQRGADLLFVAAALRLDRVGDHRLGELDRRGRGTPQLLSAEQIARQRFLELGDGAEVAGLDLRHRGLGLALEQEQMPEPFRHVAGDVVHGGVGLERARDHPEQRDPSGERIGDRLPDEGRERAGLRRLIARSRSPLFASVTPNPRSAGDWT